MYQKFNRDLLFLLRGKSVILFVVWTILSDGHFHWYELFTEPD